MPWALRLSLCVWHDSQQSPLGQICVVVAFPLRIAFSIECRPQRAIVLEKRASCDAEYSLW